MKSRAEKERDRYKKDPVHRARLKAKNKAYRLDNRNSDGVIARRKFYTIKLNAKTRGLKMTVNTAYLRELLVAQDRKCAMTGRPLNYQGSSLHNDAPSIDRIDRSKGYVEENVRWVTYQVNCALAVGTEEEFLKMCSDALAYSKAKR